MANLECLRDYVGIDWCGATTAPPSGLYLNSLPGISFKGLSAIGKEEQQTFAGTWNDIQTRAMKRFEHDLRQKFHKRVRLKSLVQSNNLGWKIDSDEQFNFNSAQYVGFTVDLGCNPDDNYMESAYFEVYLQDLYVWSGDEVSDITATVRVYEVDTGVAIYCNSTTFATMLPNTWTKIPVNFNFIRDRESNDFEILNNSEKYLVSVGFNKSFTSYMVPIITDDFCECCDYRIRPAYIEEAGVPVNCLSATNQGEWSSSGGAFCSIASYVTDLELIYAGCFDLSETYKFTVTVSGYGGGSVAFKINGTTQGTISANGVYIYSVTGVAPGATMSFTPSSFVGCIAWGTPEALTLNYFTDECDRSKVPTAGITNETTLRGVTAIIGSRCSYDRMVCSNKDVFVQAWWYLLGVETMNEQMYSERLNRYTTIDRKKAGELRPYYEVMYGGGTIDGIVYEGALTQAVDGIDVDCSDCCVECSASPALEEMLP